MSLLVKLSGVGLALGILIAGAASASTDATPGPDAAGPSARSAEQDRYPARTQDRRRDSGPGSRTAVQIEQATREALAGAGLTCELTGSAEIGEIEGGNFLYEAACAQGAGYLVTSGEAPEVFDCLQLGSALERHPPAEGETATQCTLPANKDRAAMIAPLARAANISCRVDNGLHLGVTNGGGNRYEVGCAGSDGFWIDVDATGAASKISCLTVTADDGECRYTTSEEQTATIRERFAGANAPACTVEQGRGAGATSAGEYFEVKCAGGAGYMVRTNLAGEFEQAYPCEQALSIVGGCKLTDLSGVLATVSERRKSQLSAIGVSCTFTAEVKIGQERVENGREVVEFACAETPIGLVAYLPLQDDGVVTVRDCLSAAARGITCRATSPDRIREALSASLRAGGTECTVAEFRAKGPLADGSGDSVEVKCSDGARYLADVPSDRRAPSPARACDGLPASEACTI